MKKCYIPSPFVKCKTKKPDSEQMEIMKGSFFATVSLKNVCDETSEGGSWITESDRSKTTGNDVFLSQTGESTGKKDDKWSLCHIREDSITSSTKEADEEVYSPIESSRRSEKHEDECGLRHSREDIIASPTKDAVADILSSPEKCSRSDSEKNQSNISSKGKIRSKVIEEMKDFASMLNCNENVLPKFKKHRKGGDKSNLFEEDYEIRSERVFDATRIVDPKIGKILLPSSKSSYFVPGYTGGSKHISKHRSPENNTLFNKSSGKISASEGERKETVSTVNQDVQKAITEKLSSSYSKKAPKSLHSQTQIRQLSIILSQEDKEEICETPKGAAHMFPRRPKFVKEKSRSKAVEKVPSKLSTFNKNRMKNRSPGKLISSTSKSLEYEHNVKSSKGVKSPPHNVTDNADLPARTSFILKKNTSQSKESEEKELLYRKWNIPRTKVSRGLFKEKSFTVAPLSMQTDDVMPVEPAESRKACSTEISKENTAKSKKGKIIKSGQKHKKILETKWEKKHRHKSKEKASKEERHFLSSVSTNDSIKNFIVIPDSKESTEKDSMKITEKNNNADLNRSVDSWESYAALKMKKKRETNNEVRDSLEELEEEIVSTPSSTTVNKDSIDMIDTSETESASSKKSENSTDKFLEEMGLYESEHSVEAKSSKLTKRKLDLKKRKSKKVSAEKKSLEVELQEYKEYLKTIPIDDLSLKKRRARILNA